MVTICTTRFHIKTSPRSTRNRGSTVVKVLCTNRKVAGSIPAGGSGFFIGVDSSCNINEYQEYFLGPGVFPGGKGGRCVGLTTYHHPVPLSRNLGTLTSWKPLGLSRPVMRLIYLLPVLTTQCVYAYRMIPAAK